MPKKGDFFYQIIEGQLEFQHAASYSETTEYGQVTNMYPVFHYHRKKTNLEKL